MAVLILVIGVTQSARASAGCCDPRPVLAAAPGPAEGPLGRVTVALVSVAEGMAYALVAGVDPVYGLYAGSVSVLVGSLLASSSLLVITATNALALVAADHIGALGDDVDPATALFTLTVLVGVVMAGLGPARLGSVVRFISAEVQAGLVAAVALLIVLGQYDELVGYSSDAALLAAGRSSRLSTSPRTPRRGTVRPRQSASRASSRWSRPNGPG